MSEFTRDDVTVLHAAIQSIEAAGNEFAVTDADHAEFDAERAGVGRVIQKITALVGPPLLTAHG